MRAAVIEELGQPPAAGEYEEPAPGDGDVIVQILAAPLNPIDIAVSSGRLPAGHPPLPYVPGCEGVGTTEAGELVWAVRGGLGIQRNGSLAERVRIDASALVPVPTGTDPALAGALGIAGMAGWLPVAWRAPVREGETVLVLGATGTVGRVAVQAARLLGAGRIVAVGRNREALERMAGAAVDATVTLDGGDLAERLREACGGNGPDLIVDPLWGEPLVAAVEIAAPGARIVQLGQSAGAEATLTSAAIRFKGIELLGHSNFNVPQDVLEREYARLVSHATAGQIQVDVEQVPLEDVAEAWRRQAEGPGRKLVIVP